MQDRAGGRGARAKDDADAVPRVGDFVTVEGRACRHEVAEVVFHYAIKKGRKHTVEVTARPL